MAGIYIHIPFCRQACSYCDFHFSTQLKNRGALIQAIVRELKNRNQYLQKERIETIYLGGGTPSLISPNELELLLNTIYNYYPISESIEICLEANPEDLSCEYLKSLHKIGVNRLSIGIQSFHKKDLDLMNRNHTGQEAIAAVRNAQEQGFKNISIDLIFGSPSTNHQMWQDNLEQFFSLGIPHLSAYSLTIEDKTALKHNIEKGLVSPPKDEHAFKQYVFLQEMIKKHAYEQYELSNYCQDEQYSKHNSSYWSQVPYLGVGPSAHSFDGISRQWNISNNALYIKHLNSGAGIFEREELSEQDKYHEYLITSLRNKWGISTAHLKNEFSTDVQKAFYLKLNKLNESMLTQTDKSIHIKKEHWFQADGIIRGLWLD